MLRQTCPEGAPPNMCSLLKKTPAGSVTPDTVLIHANIGIPAQEAFLSLLFRQIVQGRTEWEAQELSCKRSLRELALN